MDERKETVIHFLQGTFPLDRSFFGETFVVGEHVLHSSHETAVSSSLNRGLPRDLFDFQAVVAKEAFNTTLLNGTPDSAYGRVSRFPQRDRENRFTKRKRTRAPAEDFGFFLGNALERGPVMLDLHYPPNFRPNLCLMSVKDYSIEELKIRKKRSRIRLWFYSLLLILVFVFYELQYLSSTTWKVLFAFFVLIIIINSFSFIRINKELKQREDLPEPDNPED